MFKKLKEKIAEEVKPLKISQFTQSVVLPGSSSVVDSPPDESFSLGDELPEDNLGNEGFSVVDLHHPSVPLPLSSGRFSRQSSMSSLASDASTAFFPIHDASLGAFNMQDFESTSEREDVMPQMNSVSKQELCNAYMKLYRHYQKYKGRATDLRNFCRELEKDNKKHKTVLLECQEKSLRRMAELKEQCALEQHAKAHLEEALRNDLEEKDHLIQTLQTKIRLLKEAHAASSSLSSVEGNLSLLGETSENIVEKMSVKRNLETHQEQSNEQGCEEKSSLLNLSEESKTKEMKEKIEYLKEYIFNNSYVDIKNASLKAQLQKVLDEISVSVQNKEDFIPQTYSSDQEKLPNNEIHVCNVRDIENDDKMLITLGEVTETQNLISEYHRPEKKDNQETSATVLEAVPLTFDISDKNLHENVTCTELKSSDPSPSNSSLEIKDALSPLEKELSTMKANLEEITRELETAHQQIMRKDSAITDLNDKLAILQNEVQEATNQKNEGIKTTSNLKCELVETKLQLEELRQKLQSEQVKVEQNDSVIEDTNKNLSQIRMELEELMQKFQLEQCKVAQKDSVIEDTKKDLAQTAQELEELLQKFQIEQSKGLQKDLVIEATKKDLAQTHQEQEDLLQMYQSEQSKVEQKNSVIEKISKNLAQTHQDLNMISVQKNEITETLENELKTTKDNLEKLTQEVQSQNKLLHDKESSIKVLKEEVAQHHKQFDITNTQNLEANAIIESLQNELKERIDQFDQLTQKLESASKLAEEKDLCIADITMQLNSHREASDAADTCKVEALEMVAALESELRVTKLQCQKMAEDLQSARQMIDERDSNMAKMNKDVATLQQELVAASSQKSQTSNIVVGLQNELTNTQLKLEQMSQDLQSAYDVVKEKDATIASISQDLTKIHKELDTVSFQRTETKETVSVLQNELADSKIRYEEIECELQSAHELIRQNVLTISGINEDFCKVCKERDIALSEKAEVNSALKILEKEVMEKTVKFDQIAEDLLTAHEQTEKKDLHISKINEDLEKVHNELAMILSQETEKGKMIEALQSELMDTKCKCDEITQELQAANNVIQEKDLTITSVNEDLSTAHKKLDAAISQETDDKELMESLKKELTDTKITLEQTNVDLESAQRMGSEKDSYIIKISEELNFAHKELETALPKKNKASEMITYLQNELLRAKLNCEELSEELESTQKLICEKDATIANLNQDILNCHELMDKTTVQKNEANEIISDLQSELANTKGKVEKMSQALLTVHQVGEEKNLTIAHITEDLVSVHKGLETLNIEKATLSSFVQDLQNKLTEANLKFEQVNLELQSAYQTLETKNSDIAALNEDFSIVHQNLNTTSYQKVETCEILETTQKELMNLKFIVQQMTHDLETNHKIIEEKDFNIACMKEDINKINQEFNITSTEKAQLCENAMHLQDELKETKLSLQNLESTCKRLEDEKQYYMAHINENVTDTCSNAASNLSAETSSPKVSLQSKAEDTEFQHQEIYQKFQSTCENIEGDTHNNEMKDETGVDQETIEKDPSYHVRVPDLHGERNSHGAHVWSDFGSSCREVELCNKSFDQGDLLHDNNKEVQNRNRRCDDVPSELCENDQMRSIKKELHRWERKEEEKENCNVRNDHDDSQILKSSSSGSEEHNSMTSSKKNSVTESLCQEQFLLQSLHYAQKITDTNPRKTQGGQLVMGLEESEHQRASLQMSSIKDILEEIQKENKEYGSLLEYHKNLINHLEDIVELSDENIQQGTAEWLHKQLISLSHKLYDTKEKQRSQIANINKLLKLQEDSTKSIHHESHMTIEMQYLRNIVFQYMIGKETMLLAKVISAVMKFDQQQVDQVMQKELQKQTLLGQLGLL